MLIYSYATFFMMDFFALVLIGLFPMNIIYNFYKNVVEIGSEHKIFAISSK